MTNGRKIRLLELIDSLIQLFGYLASGFLRAWLSFMYIYMYVAVYGYRLLTLLVNSSQTRRPSISLNVFDVKYP